ncbi:MAG: nucleoside hydrolase, partial [Gammaproteobacteria bacterium]
MKRLPLSFGASRIDPEGSWIRQLTLLLAVIAGALGTVVMAHEGVGLANECGARGSHAPQPTVVITDLAYLSDDSMALLTLLGDPNLDIKGIIATAGNVSAARAKADAERFLQEVAGRSMAVIEGPPLHFYAARRKYFVEVQRAASPPPNFVGVLGEPEWTEQAQASAVSHAAQFLIKQAKEAEGRLHVVLQGPATVIAQALKLDSAFAGEVAGIMAMGGAIRVAGNSTRFAEFNVWFDPEAMAEVLRSGMSLTFVPLDATEQVQY